MPSTGSPCPGVGLEAYEPCCRLPAEEFLRQLSDDDRQLLQRVCTEPIEYVCDPLFESRGVEARLFGSTARLADSQSTYFAEDPALMNEFAAVEGTTLTAEQEREMFRRYNYARRAQALILKRTGRRALTRRNARLLLAWAHRALMIRGQIVQLNVPLVLAMAKRTRLSGVDFNELVSEGNMALLRSVDKFDWTRGYKFSTYACRAILKSFSRVALRASRYRARFPTEFDPTMEKSDYLERQREEQAADCVSELWRILDRNSANLNEIERVVIRERFAVDTPPGSRERPKTLEQVGSMIGVTKERVRQIQNKALNKLRAALDAELLSG